MPFQFFNTLGHKKEEFQPENEQEVRIYSCGPTVYDRAHIGNFASFLMGDLLVRSLEKIGGWKVKWVVNITDVGHLTLDEEGMADQGEDKLEKGAKKMGKSPQEVAEFFTQKFLEDWKKLGMREPEARPKASEFVPQIIEFVKDLEEKGFAYETADGVYFEIEKWPKYGELSGNKLENLKAGARVEIREEKKNPFDFALWKKAVGEHEKAAQVWDSPWGKGFPGWHIECSVMSEEIFGKSGRQAILDMHSGGEDHIFPHHECEIAQTGARDEMPLARFWLHKKHLLVDSQKMSKSKGTGFTLDDLEEKGFSPLDFKWLLLGTQFRNQLNFTWEGMEAAKKSRMKLQDFWQRVQEFEPRGKEELEDDFPQFQAEEWVKAMQDDLNTPAALGALHDMMKEANVKMDKGILSKEEKEKVMAFLGLMESVWGVLGEGKEEAPLEVRKMAEERMKARQDDDWAKSDELRDKIKEMGWEVRDKEGGWELRKG